MSLRRLLAVWHARNLEFLRDRSTLIFNFLFPLALIVAFAVIFGGQPRALFKVDVVVPPGTALESGRSKGWYQSGGASVAPGIRLLRGLAAIGHPGFLVAGQLDPPLSSDEFPGERTPALQH